MALKVTPLSITAWALTSPLMFIVVLDRRRANSAPIKFDQMGQAGPGVASYLRRANPYP